ncbi:uncharacterized protein B0H18DRAFT_474251 [Fomitopsis serialis]|uniref:uncharacterized protein n=1 Tax=Fomitopsis serialis TaxID=139415 RepID=UPI002007D20A|nr:uncharacterized protein B0H18DRAFT_474251 [Neoantrodia serialis]KAH9923258.1 hypothetical protein B0H18DRAFT_474251 [Neoantrodia serialis]
MGMLLAAPYKLQLRKLQWMPSLWPTDFQVGEPALHEMFDRSGRTLETLELEVDCAAQRIEWLMGQGLSHHRSLKFLTLSFNSLYCNWAQRDWSIVPLFISSLDSSSLRELHLHFDAHHEIDSGDAFDWQRLPKALISLHGRCPAVTLLLSWCSPIRMQTEFQDLVAFYGKTLRDVLRAGMRIAVVRIKLDESSDGNGYEAAVDYGWWPARTALTWL